MSTVRDRLAPVNRISRADPPAPPKLPLARTVALELVDVFGTWCGRSSGRDFTVPEEYGVIWGGIDVEIDSPLTRAIILRHLDRTGRRATRKLVAAVHGWLRLEVLIDCDPCSVFEPDVAEGAPDAR